MPNTSGPGLVDALLSYVRRFRRAPEPDSQAAFAHVRQGAAERSQADTSASAAAEPTGTEAAASVAPTLIVNVPSIEESLHAILGTGTSLIAVDVGGANGLQPHWHKLRGTARFVVYEPHGESFDALLAQQARDASYKDFLYLKEALAEQEGPRTLYLTNSPTGSSLIPPKKGGFGDHPRDTYFWPCKTETIETTTLARSLDRQSIDRIDMIKLDTQGSELEILRGLDAKRLADLLLIETEVSLLDFYESGETGLEDMLRFMRENHLAVFDFRTNRFIGNAYRLDPDALASMLGSDLALPPNAHRLYEIDAVFIRDPLEVLRSGTDASRIRRLIAILATYLFFPEAAFTVSEARERGILRPEEAEEVLFAIRDIRDTIAREPDLAAEAARRAGGSNWAQYMWVPYPSA